MIQIGKNRIERHGGLSRLTAEAVLDGRAQTLWFAVDGAWERGLTIGRADSFLLALLPDALRSGHAIVCEDPVSRRLWYQLTEYLIPALTASGPYRPVEIRAPLAAEPCPGGRAVATGFSGSRVVPRGGGPEPLTHLAVFGDAGDPALFRDRRQQAADAARALGLELLCVSHNLEEAEPAVLRELACALALQGLLSLYLRPMEGPGFRPEDSAFLDFLAGDCASTESLRVRLFYPEGPEAPESRAPAIRIGRPFLREAPGQVRLCAPVELRGRETELWFSVDPEYAPCLTADRADAFVAALLTTAMREGRDLICDAPVSRRLLWQLNEFLIPTMAANLACYQRIRIHGEAVGEPPACRGAVGTGWTGGVDSLFTVVRHLENPACRLTHLLIASNGAIEGEDPSDTLRRMGEKARAGIVPELGLELVCVDSNLQAVLPENFHSVVPVRHGATVLALQGLFRTFLVSSGFALRQFSFAENTMELYESLVLSCLETEGTVLYAAGSPFTRTEKLRQLSESPLAWRYLHPCIYALRDNCGACPKCLRTEAALYALGTLDRFSPVFDAEDFRKHKDLRFASFLAAGHADLFFDEVLEACRENGVHLSRAKRLALWKKLRNIPRALRAHRP